MTGDCDCNEDLILFFYVILELQLEFFKIDSQSLSF